ncbi:uncharacterized protein [Aegilops tauschii subsp. strangulata]|uniref:uncharacterized protein n=1 Tax=Aegilops tauschii subsp. strangulata TaxID=200361 RepID=UPI000989DBF6|nr:uncharacterized protein LOC109754848 [Aegilops tauschii subsp. strangulata]
MRFRDEAAAEGRTPAWLGPLLGAEFFKPCATHPYLVKNECNHYCLDCAGEDDAICCTQCVSVHPSHHIVQAPQHGVKCVGPAGVCLESSRGLVDANFLFCSLSCKLDGMVSDPNLTFIVDQRRNQEDPSLETGEDDDEGGDGLPGSSNRPPGWISYRRRPRKGIPERAPFY